MANYLLSELREPRERIPIFRAVLKHEDDSKLPSIRARYITTLLQISSIEVEDSLSQKVCEGQCLETARRELRILLKTTKTSDPFRIIAQAELLLAEEHNRKAFQLLSTQCPTILNDYSRCFALWVNSAERLGLDQLDKLGPLIAPSCPTSKECAIAYKLLAMAYDHIGSQEKARLWRRRTRPLPLTFP